jgi:hypothetical protein
MSDFERDIDRLLAGDQTLAPPVPLEPPATAVQVRPRWHLGVAAALAISLGIVVALVSVDETAAPVSTAKGLAREAVKGQAGGPEGATGPSPARATEAPSPRPSAVSAGDAPPATRTGRAMGMATTAERTTGAETLLPGEAAERSPSPTGEEPPETPKLSSRSRGSRSTAAKPVVETHPAEPTAPPSRLMQVGGDLVPIPKR